MERYYQNETYYPYKQEPDNGVTTIAFGICRLTDGYWNDFNDSTFKNVGWTTKYQAMAEDDNGMWIYTTGWAIPNANATYAIHFQITDATGTFYAEGQKLVVFDDGKIVEGTLTEIQLMRLLLATLAGKSAGGGTATITFRDNADSKARVTATVDSNGNRTAVILDGS